MYIYYMNINLVTTFDYFIIFIIIVKIIFILASIGHVILNNSGKNPDLDNKLYSIKKQTEFIFVACMAVLLIYYFKPGNNKPINKEISFLFFLFGWILIITAEWSTFLKDTVVFKQFIKKYFY